MGTQRLIAPRRILKLLILSGLLTVFGFQLLAPAWMAFTITRPLQGPVCCETPASFGANYTSIQFTTADGLKLSAWYLPPRNGAVIILIHGYYGDRRQTLPVAAMLYKHGYGLLMYDQRASGESQGSRRSLGALDIPDLARAAAWLSSTQKDLRLGAYGCSMGGAIAIAGAVDVPSIRAVTADAPSPLRWFENRPAFSLQDPISLPTMALYYFFVRLFSGAASPASTLDYIHAYAARPILFISSGQTDEFAGVSADFAAADGPKEHWNIPDAIHCTGVLVHPQEYEQRLVRFYDTYLQK